jgi:transcriptional regulatory protein RtcR
MVSSEIETLQTDWKSAQSNDDFKLVAEVMGGAVSEVDPFDLVQLAEVIRVCRRSSSLSAAGRALFAVSRGKRKTQNDSDRLRKYLGKFGLEWGAI